MKKTKFLAIIVIILSIVLSSGYNLPKEYEVLANDNDGKTVIIDAGHGGLTNTTH